MTKIPYSQCRGPGLIPGPGTGRSPGVGWQPTPILLPGTIHGQRDLMGYSPWRHKEWDTTEHTVHTQGTRLHILELKDPHATTKDPACQVNKQMKKQTLKKTN